MLMLMLYSMLGVFGYQCTRLNGRQLHCTQHVHVLMSWSVVLHELSAVHTWGLLELVISLRHIWQPGLGWCSQV